MARLPRFARLAAAVAILLSTITVVGVTPSGAEPSASGSAVPNGFNGTATISYADTSDFQVYIIDGSGECDTSGGQPTAGILGTIGVDSPAPASPFTVNTETLVGPSATALGSGNFLFCLYDETEGWTLLELPNVISIFDPVTSSLTDNGNGSVTLTYSNVNYEFSQQLYLYLFSNLTTCPEEPLNIAGFAWQADLNMPDSPFAVGVGTLGTAFPISEGTILLPDPEPVTAGSYAACSYMPNTETGDIELSQSLLVSIYTPSEPVIPAFTG